MNHAKNNQENLISKLLAFMNDELEKEGASIYEMDFNFYEKTKNSNKNDLAPAMKHCGIEDESDVDKILKVCISRKLIKKYNAYYPKRVCLTEEGQAQGISYKKQDSKIKTEGAQINVTNENGQVQIGDYNRQQINIIEKGLEAIIEKIKKSDLDKKEKKKLKKHLYEVFKNPIFTAVISQPIIETIKKCF